MTIALPRAKFQEFGPSRLTRLLARPLVELALPVDDGAARRAVRAAIDDRPGVYGMVGLADELIYVGKSKALRERLVTYLFDHEGTNAKSRRIISHTRRIVIEPAACEFVALLRELELIRRWRPRFNVQGQPGRIRRVWLSFPEVAATAAMLSPRPARGAVACFGPLPAGNRARLAVERLNHTFRLRDCPSRTRMYFADQQELFDADRRAQCLRFEIGDCLGPCAGGCTRAEYRRQVALAVDFLEGRDFSCLDALAYGIEQAIAARRFESAARLHETHEALAWLSSRLEQLRGVQRKFTFVYRVPHAARGESWYLVQSGQVTAVGPRPLAPRTAQRWLTRLPGVAECGSNDCQADPELAALGQPADGSFAQDVATATEVASLAIAATQRGAAETPYDIEQSMLVARWFRENRGERRNTLTV
ncbi:MAG: hypothetical protein WEA31_03610, partial [Pirellulales bacterium]